MNNVINLAYNTVSTHSQNLFKGYLFSPYPNDQNNAGRALTADGRHNYCEQFYQSNLLLEADKDILRQATVKQNTEVENFVNESDEMMAKMGVYNE